MVGTKHCCWGECKTESRYPEKWPESLKELENSGQRVFIHFPKPMNAMYPRLVKKSIKETFVTETFDRLK